MLYVNFIGMRTTVSWYSLTTARQAAIPTTMQESVPSRVMEGVAEIMVPKGTKMIKGTVGSQAKEYGFPFYGGRTQYYSPSLENFVRVK